MDRAGLPIDRREDAPPDIEWMLIGPRSVIEPDRLGRKLLRIHAIPKPADRRALFEALRFVNDDEHRVSDVSLAPRRNGCGHRTLEELGPIEELDVRDPRLALSDVQDLASCSHAGLRAT
jgi:hypothetical protein